MPPPSMAGSSAVTTLRPAWSFSASVGIRPGPGCGAAR
jgi:hypothetical protein